MKFQSAEINPYLIEQLVEEQRRELLRSAESWRLAHPVQMPTPKRGRWIPPLPWRRAPVKPARSALPLNRPRYESKNAPDTLQADWLSTLQRIYDGVSSLRQAYASSVRRRRLVCRGEVRFGSSCRRENELT